MGDLESFLIVDFFSYLGCVIYNDIVLENELKIQKGYWVKIMTYFKNIIGIIFIVFITLATIIFCIGRCFQQSIEMYTLSRPGTLRPSIQDSPTSETISPYFSEGVNLPE
jgi:hypothetical protein